MDDQKETPFEPPAGTQKETSEQRDSRMFDTFSAIEELFFSPRGQLFNIASSIGGEDIPDEQFQEFGTKLSDQVDEFSAKFLNPHLAACFMARCLFQITMSKHMKDGLAKEKEIDRPMKKQD